MKTVSLDPTSIKNLNMRKVFHYIYAHTRCTKQSIASDLNLSLPTVANCIASLFDNQMICYDGSAESTGGRKAQYITINRHLKTSIGISISLNHLRIIALDLRGNISDLSVIKYSYTTFPELAKLLSEKLETFINEKKIERSSILGVGIALPASFSAEQTIIDHAPIFQVKNIAVSELTRYIPYPCRVSNDADCGGYCELMNDSTVHDLIYLSVDRNIGGSIFFNNHHFTGDHGYSADFGHICIHPLGKPCKCGKYGCLEAYCSTDVLINDFQCSLDDFFMEVSLHTEAYCNKLDEYLSQLVIGIANLNIIFDKKIILGGGLSCFANYYSALLYKKLDEILLTKNTDRIIGFSKHGYNSSCVGAALYYITELINCI